MRYICFMKESDLLFGLMKSFSKDEYSYTDIEWLTKPFGVSETSLRSNLSRMAANNILQVRKEGRRAYYSFTTRSNKLGSNVALAFHTPDWSAWKGDWWGVSLSIPDDHKKGRYSFSKKFSYYRFAAMHPGFWIRPYHKVEQIEYRLKDILEHKFSKVLRFNFYLESELEKIPVLWKVDEINDRFLSCINYIEQCYDEYNLENPEEALIGKMTIGDIVVKQLASDPLLPEKFLPSNWSGNRLRQIFKEWIQITTKKSRPYWEKIYSDSTNSSIQNQTHHGENHKMAP